MIVWFVFEIHRDGWLRRLRDWRKLRAYAVLERKIQANDVKQSDAEQG